MLNLTRRVDSFPSVRLPSYRDDLPVEVALIAQLGPGAGNQIIASSSLRQRGHYAFIDALDEPSARLGGVDLQHGDPSSLYSFTVGPHGHPFHSHAGRRMFTAVSGSGGALLRFSTASAAQIAEDPHHFVRALRHVQIPPDCLFTVRFGGETWHQFQALRSGSTHPALFALSCHSDELDGALSDDQRLQVLQNAASIPALTNALPAAAQRLLDDPHFDANRIPSTSLALHCAPMSRASRTCASIRGHIGRARASWAMWRGSQGFLTVNGASRPVQELDAPPADSLLRTQLMPDFGHQDSFELILEAHEAPRRSAADLLAQVLQGFIDNAPLGVSWLMRLRNLLVKPLGLRTSALGCPVSSLLGCESSHLFAGRYPVHAQGLSTDGRRAQVILGADDKHLVFRSCVGVQRHADDRVSITLGTRVRARNAFGRIYIAAIDQVHRRYVTPTMLQLAVDHAIRECASHNGPIEHASCAA